MPINQDEWSKGSILSKLKPTVIKFLEGNRSQAFTDVEILESLKQDNQSVSSQGGLLTGMDSLLLLRQKLKELISEEVIESKLIEIEDSSSMMYYKFK